MICFTNWQGRNADALALYFNEDPARCPFEQGKLVMQFLMQLLLQILCYHSYLHPRMVLGKLPVGCSVSIYRTWELEVSKWVENPFINPYMMNWVICGLAKFC